MTIQSSVQIGNVIRNAVAFDGKNWMGDMMIPEPIIQSVQDLFGMLEERKIDYVLVGGIAMLHYIEGRNTQDLDLLMSLASLEKLPELKILSKDMYFVQTRYGELKIDILLTKNPLFKEVCDHYSKVQKLMDRDIPLATVEGLLLLKLYALPSLYRQGDFSRVGIYENDVATLLHDYQTDVTPLVNELGKHLSETDVTEISGILLEVQKRLDRFENKSY
jgi:hypothetical protein